MGKNTRIKIIAATKIREGQGLNGYLFLMNWSWTKRIFILLTNCVVYFVSGIVITVHFDGSLRPPYDFGVETTTLRRLAACACTISVPDRLQPFVVIGGKSLPATSLSTSGEVEYEGLLFALNALHSYIKTQRKDFVTNSQIIIKGDCKTVIDQMSGISTPRKLDRFHDQALSLLNEINNDLQLVARLDKIQFQHIAREKNIICDRLSACIIADQEKNAFRSVYDDVLNFHKLDYNITTAAILDRWFQPYESIIPLSRRPAIYRCIAEEALRMKDYEGLMELVRRYEQDLRIVEKSSKLTKVSDALDASRLEWIIYQITSLNELGRNKEATRVQHKYRFLLNKYRTTVDEIQQRLSRTDELPSKTSLAVLQDEMCSNNWADEMDWPESVQNWYMEASQSLNLKSNHLEWISVI